MRSQFTAEEHRERARQCVRLAQQMADPSAKVLLLDMAQVWAKLAAQEETPGDLRDGSEVPGLSEQKG